MLARQGLTARVTRRSQLFGPAITEALSGAVDIHKDYPSAYHIGFFLTPDVLEDARLLLTALYAPRRFHLSSPDLDRVA